MGDARSADSRRALLRSGATLAAIGLSGCLGGMTAAGRRGPVGPANRSETVTILAAGSLHNAIENGLVPRLAMDGIRLRVEPHGSAEVARLVAAGAKRPAIVSLADPALFDGPLHPAWYATFATNALVLAYDSSSTGGTRLAAAERWSQPLIEGSVALGRTDPDLDPLGYRTLFALDLATRYYDAPIDLRTAILRRDQVFPETQLLSQFETGAIEAAFTYRSMALDRGYSFIGLPAAVNLSDPAYVDSYAETSYTLPGGKTVRGDVIRYAATVHDESIRPAVVRAFDRHVTGSYLDDFGFEVPASYPRFTGDVPDAIPR